MKDEIMFLYLYVLREKKKISNMFQNRMLVPDITGSKVLKSMNKIQKTNFREYGNSAVAFVEKYIIDRVYLKDIYPDKGLLKIGIRKHVKERFNERLGNIGLFPHQIDEIINKINKNVDLMWKPMSKFQKFKWWAYVWLLKLIGKMPKIEQEEEE